LTSKVEDICETLRRKYGVNEYFYPKISMDVDIPYGLEGEVNGIVESLKKAGFEINVENVFHVMQMKKKLLDRYRSSNEGKRAFQDYSKMISEYVKPVGVTIPTDLMFINLVVILLLYLAGRFLGSFLDEAGKIFARRMLIRNRKKLSKELNITDIEYDFFEKQVIKLLKDKTKIEVLVEDIKEIKSKRCVSKTRKESLEKQNS